MGLWKNCILPHLKKKKKKVFFPLGYYVACKDLSFPTRDLTGPAEKALSPKTLVLCLVTQSCLTLSPHGLQPARLLCPWGFSRKNIGVGYPTLLQGISPTQGLNPGLPHCRLILYFLSHREAQRIPIPHLLLGEIWHKSLKSITDYAILKEKRFIKIL